MEENEKPDKFEDSQDQNPTVEHASEELKEDANLAVASENCESCGQPITDINKSYICGSCGKRFCVSCPGLHIPPESEKTEAKVRYRYKLKPSSVWIEDIVKLTEILSSPNCENCYNATFDTAVDRLKTKIKHWQIDMLRDVDLKILETILPEKRMTTLVLTEKEQVVESAREFLRRLGKG